MPIRDRVINTGIRVGASVAIFAAGMAVDRALVRADEQVPEHKTAPVLCMTVAKMGARPGEVGFLNEDGSITGYRELDEQFVIDPIHGIKARQCVRE